MKSIFLPALRTILIAYGNCHDNKTRGHTRSLSSEAFQQAMANGSQKYFLDIRREATRREKAIPGAQLKYINHPDFEEQWAQMGRERPV